MEIEGQLNAGERDFIVRTILEMSEKSLKLISRCFIFTDYGAAEARLYTKNYLRNWLITLFPPLLLLSRHRFRHLGFRYKKCFRGIGLAGWQTKRPAPPPLAGKFLKELS